MYSSLQPDLDVITKTLNETEFEANFNFNPVRGNFAYIYSGKYQKKYNAKCLVPNMYAESAISSFKTFCKLWYGRKCKRCRTSCGNVCNVYIKSLEIQLAENDLDQRCAIPRVLAVVVTILPNNYTYLRGYLKHCNELNTCIQVLCNIAEGLKCLHSLQIVHCALTPDNILVDTDTHLAKITNFQNCRKVNTQFSYSNDPDFESVMLYIPEDVRNERNCEASEYIDLWSLTKICRDLNQNNHGILNKIASDLEDKLKTNRTADVDEVVCKPIKDHVRLCYVMCIILLNVLQKLS